MMSGNDDVRGMMTENLEMMMTGNDDGNDVGKWFKYINIIERIWSNYVS